MTRLAAAKSGQNTAIYSVFVPAACCLHCKKCVNTSIFLPSTCPKCCNLQCFFALLSKKPVFAVFRASLVEKVLVFTAFSGSLHRSRKSRQSAEML